VSVSRPPTIAAMGKLLRRPVYLDVIVRNYEHAPAPRRRAPLPTSMSAG